ncbi:MAG: phosphoglycolate phosphatase [Gammaproteobacteria bacterium]|nr:phosphoglycolate phosphatase [Gammaproteobacteria bacterium]
MPTDRLPEGVLFDLDGTLADTAPDLAAAVNRLRADLDLPPIDYATIRPVVSLGSPGMLRVGLGLTPESPDYESHRNRLLEHYAKRLCVETLLFPGIAELLDSLDQAQLPWGVVTNKPEALAKPLMRALGLDQRSRCLIGGDTLIEKKPHPAPIRRGCELAGIQVDRCVYVGDAQQDIEAGRAAGCRTVAALYGYIPRESDPHSWNADAAINAADELLQIDWFQGL